MALGLRDEAAFFAEYQNEPLVPYEEAGLLTATEIAAKTNGRRRGDIPAETPRLLQPTSRCSSTCSRRLSTGRSSRGSRTSPATSSTTARGWTSIVLV